MKEQAAGKRDEDAIQRGRGGRWRRPTASRYFVTTQSNSYEGEGEGVDDRERRARGGKRGRRR